MQSCGYFCSLSLVVWFLYIVAIRDQLIFYTIFSKSHSNHSIGMALLPPLSKLILYFTFPLVVKFYTISVQGLNDWTVSLCVCEGLTYPIKPQFVTFSTDKIILDCTYVCREKIIKKEQNDSSVLIFPWFYWQKQE